MRLPLLSAIALICAASTGAFYHWVQTSPEFAPPPQQNLSANDADNLAQFMAFELDHAAPISLGAVEIIGARYSKADHELRIDVRQNMTEFGGLPEEIFLLAASQATQCKKQSQAVLSLNRNNAVRYYAFNAEGRRLDVLGFDRKACTALPIKHGMASRREFTSAFAQPG